MTLENRKPVYGIRIKDTAGVVPAVLTRNGIKVHPWSEDALQFLAIK
jgi:hypothetical protein